MEIKKRKLKVTFEGQAYELAFPSVKMIKWYQDEFGKLENKDASLIEHGQKFLDKLGLPLEVSDEMEAENLTEIVSILSGQKKI